MNSSINRRHFAQSTALGAAALSMNSLPAFSDTRKPNVIFILADDLGYNEVGAYGQEKIRTPHLDALAREGMRFTQAYSGSPVCAPSRCTLLTGLHTGHAYIRDNYEIRPEGQLPLPEDTFTIGHMFQDAGYITGCVGKWGLGGPDSSGHPNRQGFDHFYGYLCQRIAHSYYPTSLWRNGQKDWLDNPPFPAHQRFDGDPPDDPAFFDQFSGNEYAPDAMIEEALGFIRTNKDRPFFLYVPTPVPHVAIQVPDDSLQEYEGEFPETTYMGDRGYLPHPTPRAGYAAMVTRMDDHIGRIMSLLKELGLDDNTLVMFSSDNGPTFNGGSDSEFFNSAGPLRGLKCDVYEGGIRVPMIARWPGKIEAGSTSDHVCAFWDLMPTFSDVIGTNPAHNTDGLGFAPTLLGDTTQAKHEYLYWEYHSFRGRQAIRMGDWKGVRMRVHENPDAPLELYNLARDIGETTDMANREPEIAARLLAHIKNTRTPSHIPRWNIQ